MSRKGGPTLRELEDELISCVRISFFKPMGFEDTHYVKTEDRGLALKKVLEIYSDKELSVLNYVWVTYVSAKNIKIESIILP